MARDNRPKRRVGRGGNKNRQISYERGPSQADQVSVPPINRVYSGIIVVTVYGEHNQRYRHNLMCQAFPKDIVEYVQPDLVIAKILRSRCDAVFMDYMLGPTRCETLIEDMRSRDGKKPYIYVFVTEGREDARKKLIESLMGFGATDCINVAGPFPSYDHIPQIRRTARIGITNAVDVKSGQ